MTFKLFQNYPNPFNPKTTIKYQVSELSFVTLKIYGVLGNEIETLVDEEKPNGNYEVKFNSVGRQVEFIFISLKSKVTRKQKRWC